MANSSRSVNADPAYNELDLNPLDSINESIKEKLNDLVKNNHLSLKFSNVLKVNEKIAQLGNFRLMAKVHKAEFDWRAIINCTNHPTSKLAMFFDFLIKPIIINSETYIKDSQHLIQYCESLEFKVKPNIYSLDVASLYPSIEPSIAVPLITEFISKYLDYSHINNFGFKSLLELFFASNIFKFKLKFFVQTKGVPIGCICGPAIANLFLYILEMKWIFIYKPLGYKRYIDDICIFTKDELNLNIFQSFFMNLKFTLNTGNVVNFLDLNMSYNNITKKIKFSLYIKPTHVNKYLLPYSNHPSHICKNIIVSLLIRIKRICSDYFDFINATKNLSLQLLERGYDYKKLSSTFKLISNVERNVLLPYKIKDVKLDFSKNILFFFKFNFNIHNFNDLVFSSFNNLNVKYPILKNFSLKFVNTIEVNLNKLLVHKFDVANQPSCKTTKCNNCDQCRYIYNMPFIKLKSSDITIKLLCNATCQASNVVYIILCLKCNLFYIGQSAKTLSKRISQHLNHIRKFKAFNKYYNKEVAKHFNLKDHELSHFKCCVFQKNLFDINERQSVEMDLLKFLNINYIRCLNLFVSKKNITTFAFNSL